MLVRKRLGCKWADVAAKMRATAGLSDITVAALRFWREQGCGGPARDAAMVAFLATNEPAVAALDKEGERFHAELVERVVLVRKRLGCTWADVAAKMRATAGLSDITWGALQKWRAQAQGGPARDAAMAAFLATNEPAVAALDKEGEEEVVAEASADQRATMDRILDRLRDPE